jgi:hypothetical protein
MSYLDSDMFDVGINNILKAFDLAKVRSPKTLNKWVEKFPEQKEELVKLGISKIVVSCLKKVFPDIPVDNLYAISLQAAYFIWDEITDPEKLEAYSVEDKDNP